MAIMTRSGFSDTLSTSALPFLRQIIKAGAEGKYREEWFQQVFNMETTDQPFEQYSSLANYGLPVETDEGAPVTYDTMIQGFDKTSAQSQGFIN